MKKIGEEIFETLSLLLVVHLLGCLLKKEGEKSKADVVDLLNYEKNWRANI